MEPMTTWTPIAKPTFPTSSVVGTPIGLLLALTRTATVTVDPWTPITKPSGTAWTSIAKAS